MPKLVPALRAMVSNPAGAAVGMERRPMLFNPDGSVSTERSITVQDPRLMGGRWANIPSIWDGQELEQDDAVRRAAASRQGFPSFDTLDEAEAEAVGRSSMLGRRVDSILRGLKR